jgi:pimeloyl-ACP methyl ester carboxylesterase
MRQSVWCQNNPVRSAILCLGLAGGFALFGLDDTPGAQLVSVGDHRLFVHCTGSPSETTVILENGFGGGLEIWKTVQASVEGFSRVCSYDRAGEGHSDKLSRLQPADAVVTDLHRLLEIERIPGPYVLVGASLGGIYVRRFALRYPDLTAGIVLADSSHEEQHSHHAAISPALGEREATQDGRFDRNEFLQAAGQLEPGERLEWHLDVPLIVLEHKRFTGPPRTEEDQLAVDWHTLQLDLAGRSRYGKLIETTSGHVMAVEQPKIVVESIRDVIRQAKTLKSGALRK